jgi:hypothetical protein
MLAARTEARTFSHEFNIQVRLIDQLVSQGDPEPINVVRNVHSGVFMKQPREMAITGTGDARELSQIPALGRLTTDRILNSVHRRVDVIAALQPR